jgi:hypothetical protein
MSCRYTFQGAPESPVGETAAGHCCSSKEELPRRRTVGVFECLDGGHFTDAFMAVVEEANNKDEDIPVLDNLAATYTRWAARLANEYKLRFGIPKRTEANRLVAREWLHKQLSAKNTRYQHMRAVIPVAVEMCFLKDESDLEVDRMMLHPSMVRRAHQSVKPYWEHTTWAGWFADKILPSSAVRALSTAFPGTFRKVPGFTA